MKVIIADAGTDPTTTPLKTSKSSGGLPPWIEENKVLVLAVIIFLIVTAARIIPREAPPNAPDAATQQPTAIMVATPAIAPTEPPGACVGGPPGEWSGFHQNGIYENGVLFVLQVEPRFTARCEDGTWEFSFK